MQNTIRVSRSSDQSISWSSRLSQLAQQTTSTSTTHTHTLAHTLSCVAFANKFCYCCCCCCTSIYYFQPRRRRRRRFLLLFSIYFSCFLLLFSRRLVVSHARVPDLIANLVLICQQIKKNYRNNNNSGKRTKVKQQQQNAELPEPHLDRTWALSWLSLSVFVQARSFHLAAVSNCVVVVISVPAGAYAM